MSLRVNNLYEEAYPFDHIRSKFIGIIYMFENNIKLKNEYNIFVDIDGISIVREDN